MPFLFSVLMLGASDLWFDCGDANQCVDDVFGVDTLLDPACLRSTEKTHSGHNYNLYIVPYKFRKLFWKSYIIYKVPLKLSKLQTKDV